MLSLSLLLDNGFSLSTLRSGKGGFCLFLKDFLLTVEKKTVYSRSCCNVFRDLSWVETKRLHYENSGASLGFGASSSNYENMYDKIFIL